MIARGKLNFDERVVAHRVVASKRADVQTRKSEFFIENLLVRMHFIIEMIWWTGLAPWEFEFPFSGSIISTCLVRSTSQNSNPSLLHFEHHHLSLFHLRNCNPLLCMFYPLNLAFVATPSCHQTSRQDHIDSFQTSDLP